MITLRWMYVTRLNKIQNKYTSGSLNIAEKIKDYKLIWFGYVERKNNGSIINKMGEIRIAGKSENV